MRDALTPEDVNSEAFGGYRGPLVDSVRTEEVDVPPPFYRISEGDEGFEELRAAADDQLPRPTANQDSATYYTSTQEFEEWMRRMKALHSEPESDPPPSAPNSAIWWHEDDEDDELDALRPTG